MEDRHEEAAADRPGADSQSPHTRGTAAVRSASAAGGTLDRALAELRERAQASAGADAAPDNDTAATATPELVWRGGTFGAFVCDASLDAMTLGSLTAWQRLQASVHTALAAGRGLVALNCRAIGSIDSIGLGRLIVLDDDIREKGSRLALIGAPEAARSLISMMGLATVLRCYDTVEEAEAAEREEQPATNGTAGAPVGQEPPAEASTAAAVSAELQQLIDGLTGEMRDHFHGFESIKANFANLGKVFSQLQTFMSDVATRLTAFEQHLNRLTGYFNERFRSDRSSQAAFDKLHEELKFYRDDVLFRSQKPIFMDLVLLYDDVGRMIRDETDPETVKKFSLLQGVITEILYRRDVEPIEDRPVEFDKAIQKAIQRVPTTVEAEDRTVAEVVREGFRWGEHVLRPQEVIVRRFNAGTAEASTSRESALPGHTGKPSGDSTASVARPAETADSDRQADPPAADDSEAR